MTPTRYFLILAYSISCRLRTSKLPFRLVTNETQATTANLVKDLVKLGFNVTEEEIFAPAPVLASILEKNKSRPYLLVHKQVRAA